MAALAVAGIGVLGAIGAALIAAADHPPSPSEAIQLVAVRCEPVEASPGERVTIYYDVKATGDAGIRVDLGASLYLGDGQEVYDESGDRTVTVVPGESTGSGALSRTFELPPDLETGEYELGGEVWEAGTMDDDDAQSLDDAVCSLTVPSDPAS